MVQGKKKREFMGRGGSISAWGKGVDCVIRGERNLCTMLGGLGFTGLFFLEYFRATGRLSGRRGRTRGADEGRLRAQRAVGQTLQLARLALLLLSTGDGCVLLNHVMG